MTQQANLNSCFPHSGVAREVAVRPGQHTYGRHFLMELLLVILSFIAYCNKQLIFIDLFAAAAFICRKWTQ